MSLDVMTMCVNSKITNVHPLHNSLGKIKCPRLKPQIFLPVLQKYATGFAQA